MTGVLDPRGGWQAEQCTLARTLNLISTRTAFLLLREAFYGTTKFEDFVDRVGVSEPVASARLRELVGEGMLAREPYQEPGQRTRNRYVLTDKGADFLPVLVAMMRWGDRWVDGQGGPVGLFHSDCGARVGVEVRCEAGHEVTADDLELRSLRPRAQSAAPPGAVGGCGDSIPLR
jgi:DNA-binding HxlR family transcriptional regulator